MSENNNNNRKSAKRVFIIGLDGATFDVLGPMMNEGLMPSLQYLIETGSSGILRSTAPPITPAAWTTFMTGMGPGRHGVIDFEHYDPKTNTLAFNSTFEIKEKTIWQILSENGFKIGSIHLPMTYPPQPVNGFVISGFETPSINAEFTYPPELKQIILKEIPDYSYSTNWQRGILGGRSKFGENLDYIKRSFQQGVKLARIGIEHYQPDVMMVLFKLVDNIQHKCWKYLTPEGARKYPTQRRMVNSCFAELDKCISQLVDIAHENNATILIMSDHGHGSLDGRVQPNLLLKRWGYLKFTSNVSQAKTRIKHTVSRIIKKKASRFAQPNMGIEADLAVDWNKTSACVMHAGMYGFLYINLKGRQPMGIVPPEEYESLRDELIKKFLQARDEKFNEQIFEKVVKPEELYNCKRDSNPNMPDLMLIPRKGLAVIRKIRGTSSVKWALDGRLGGTHRIEGIFVANGQKIKAGFKLDANIADITPTLLAMLELPVPVDMEGKVLLDMFDPAPEVKYEPPEEYKPTEVPETVFSEEDQRVLTERLSDLGYLE